MTLATLGGGPLRADEPAIPSADPSAAVERLVTAFDGAVFGSGRETADRKRVNKWTRPLTFSFADAAASIYLPMVERRMLAVSRLADVNYRFQNYIDHEANVFFVFVRQGDIANASAMHGVRSEADVRSNDEAGCMARRVVTDSEIDVAIAFVPIDRGHVDIAVCLHEMLMNVLGLFGYAVANIPWANSERIEFGDLPFEDAVLIGTLYDARIEPGMPRDDALAMARIIIAERIAKPGAGMPAMPTPN